MVCCQCILGCFYQFSFNYFKSKFSCGLLENKNNQRMMVDPMSVMVQSLRSFITDVTPTAVTPTTFTHIVVILPDFI